MYVVAHVAVSVTFCIGEHVVLFVPVYRPFTFPGWPHIEHNAWQRAIAHTYGVCMQWGVRVPFDDMTTINREGISSMNTALANI